MNTVKRVALIGYGTVGSEVAATLLEDQELLGAKSGAQIVLKYIIDRDPSSVTITDSEVRISDDYRVAVGDPDIDIVIEVIGGIDAAYNMVVDALRNNKHVVTANKALLSAHGSELCALARANGVSIGFEASCGGGIPILRALYSGLISNRIDALYTIINGTCNYILSTMATDGISYDKAVAQAQALGYAEADPTLDTNGEDSAHKLSIMTSLAFGYNVDLKDMAIVGIDAINDDDIQFAEERNVTIKLIASIARQGQRITASVRPTIIEKEHPLGWVNGVFSAVSVYGHSTGHTLFYGRGAGGKPTASAIISDVLGIASKEIPVAFENFVHWPDRCVDYSLQSVADNITKYYIRLYASNEPGTLATITNIIAKHRLNIEYIHQHPSAPSASDVPIYITIQPASERQVQAAIAELSTAFIKCIGMPFLEHTDDEGDKL